MKTKTTKSKAKTGSKATESKQPCIQIELTQEQLQILEAIAKTNQQTTEQTAAKLLLEMIANNWRV